MFQTEIDFTLPKGYVDAEGQLHRTGVMRLATAADEILPLKDPRVQQNPAYLAVIVLARVITRLGSLPDINAKTIEGLFASDLSYLQNLYEQLNSDAASPIPDSSTVSSNTVPSSPGSSSTAPSSTERSNVGSSTMVGQR